MYVVCYTDERGNNKWERLEDYELYEFLKSNYFNENGELIWEDLHIFSEREGIFKVDQLEIFYLALMRRVID